MREIIFYLLSLICHLITKIMELIGQAHPLLKTHSMMRIFLSTAFLLSVFMCLLFACSGNLWVHEKDVTPPTLTICLMEDSVPLFEYQTGDSILMIRIPDISETKNVVPPNYWIKAVAKDESGIANFDLSLWSKKCGNDWAARSATFKGQPDSAAQSVRHELVLPYVFKGNYIAISAVAKDVHGLTNVDDTLEMQTLIYRQPLAPEIAISATQETLLFPSSLPRIEYSFEKVDEIVVRDLTHNITMYEGCPDQAKKYINVKPTETTEYEILGKSLVHPNFISERIEIFVPQTAVPKHIDLIFPQDCQSSQDTLLAYLGTPKNGRDHTNAIAIEPTWNYLYNSFIVRNMCSETDAVVVVSPDGQQLHFDGQNRARQYRGTTTGLWKVVGNSTDALQLEIVALKSYPNKPAS